MGKKPSEDEFVNEELSEEETAAVATMADEPEAEENDQPAADATTEDAVTAGKDKTEPAGTVDLRALQEARAENRELRERHARLEERTNIILQQLSQRQDKPQTEEDAPPDPNEDIFGFAKWQAKRIEKLEQGFNERQTADRTAQEASQQERAIWDAWNQSAAVYAREQPDFPEAAKHLSAVRDQQLQALAVVDPRYDNPAFRNAQINEELKGIVLTSSQRGMNPAQAVYQIASQFGYKKADPAKAGAEAIQKTAEQQERHRSLSDAAGGEPPKALDAKALANMSDSAFKKLMDDPKRAAEVDKIMGLA